MSSVNPITREVLLKVVYYGPGLGGKTTSLQHIHSASKPEHRGKMISLATPVDRTLYFDFLPVRLPKVRGYTIRLQLFTVPGQVYYNATRKLVLTGADGVVFVADSQRDRLEANVESLDNLKENLHEHGVSLEGIPHLFQFNKRDLPHVGSAEEMDAMLNKTAAPYVLTTATTGEGVFESLEGITRGILKDLRDKRVLWSDDEPTSTRGEGFGALADEGIIQSLLQASGDKPTPVPPPPVARPTPDALRPALVQPSTRALFASLFGDDEIETLRGIESALSSGDAMRALDLLELAVTRELALAAAAIGEGAPRDPTLAALVLGVDGRRYLRFRATCRKRQGGAPVDLRDAAAGYLFFLDLRVRRSGG